jgi:hypothetical protein
MICNFVAVPPVLGRNSKHTGCRASTKFMAQSARQWMRKDAWFSETPRLVVISIREFVSERKRTVVRIIKY